MNILIYSSTIILSLSLELTSKLIKGNIIAKKGYKFDNLKLLSCNKFLYFIPFVNLIFVVKELSKYFNNNVLIPLTESEKRMLYDNFSIFNILKLNKNNNLQANMMLIYMTDGIENIIYFTKKNNKNVIISTKGPISELSEDIQYKQLDEQLQDIFIEKKKQNNNQEIENTSEKIKKLKNIKNLLLKETTRIIEKEKVYKKNIY